MPRRTRRATTRDPPTPAFQEEIVVEEETAVITDIPVVTSQRRRLWEYRWILVKCSLFLCGVLSVIYFIMKNDSALLTHFAGGTQRRLTPWEKLAVRLGRR